MKKILRFIEGDNVGVALEDIAAGDTIGIHGAALDFPAGEDVPQGADYAVRISGDSMEPRFTDRQVVCVHRQETLEPGETGIFLYRGDAYCKVLAADGDGAALVSLNRRYAPIRVTPEEELRVLGRVLG